jgi:hypothetical protein
MATKDKIEEFKQVAERLRELRTDQYRVNQKDMAAMVGCSLPSWAEYEGAKALPSPKVIVALIGHGISADWFLAGKGQMHIKDNIPFADTGIDREELEAVVKVLWSTVADLNASLTPGAAAGIVLMLCETYSNSGNYAELCEKAKQIVQIANQGKGK